MSDPTPRLLWKHAHPQHTRTNLFKEAVESKHGLHFEDYEALRQWSISHLNDFWEEVWRFTGVRATKPFTKAVHDNTSLFPPPIFFPDSRLNFAENLLFPTCLPEENSFAVIEANEVSRSHVTWKELRERVRQCSNAMREAGVKQGDCVAGYLANHCNALVAMLSTTSIGAVWTAMSPDSGVHAVLDRVQQIEPVLLFADNAVVYNGKVHDVQDKLKDIVGELPSLRACVVFRTIEDMAFDSSIIVLQHGKAYSHSEFVQSIIEVNAKLNFTQLPPNQPVYILYSSGTTEHDIQCDIHPGDRLFFFTTCTWMMWHWLVSGLATGATLILYDGSPFRPLDEKGNGELAMPQLIGELGITHFGTSAKYLSLLEQKDVDVKDRVDIKMLRAIYSTGSPLAPSTFEYVYRAFGPNINLASISGGTDIISLFGAPSQISPVYTGEIQVRGLGMAVEVWDYQGADVTETGAPGDLVCVKPFPCQPVEFWGSDGAEKYRKSYFEKFPGVWHHGDFVRLNPKTGGLIMLGRSDGVLKPAGVRFGSSEIYNVLLEHFPVIEDAVCVCRRRAHDTDEVVVLFLKMNPGETLSPVLTQNIQSVIRKDLSPRHIPGIIDECPDIPVTINGKRVEVAVKQILCGTNVKISASVANSECLDWYRHWNDHHAD